MAKKATSKGSAISSKSKRGKTKEPQTSSSIGTTQLPFVNAYGNITKMLRKIKEAATPPRFTNDFLATKLQLSGGSTRPLIPFLKRIGFLGSDGVPSDLYARFRNPTESGAALAIGLRKGFSPLYERNEYAHDLSDADLKGLVVQATGLPASSGTVRSIVGSFKALKDQAAFDKQAEGEGPPEEASPPPGDFQPPSSGIPKGLNLGYTINLHLLATSDIAVFNAIFKSIREHLLKE